MPTYQYRCTECGQDLEAVQKFSDPALTTCSACGGRLRKVFNPVGVVFKGSGFYRTDSRNGSKSRSDADSGSSDNRVDTKSTETKSTETKSGDKQSAGASAASNGNSKQQASSGTSSTTKKAADS